MSLLTVPLVLLPAIRKLTFYYNLLLLYFIHYNETKKALFYFQSGGDLQNAEALADRLTKLVYTASRIPVSPDRRETFHKISG